MNPESNSVAQCSACGSAMDITLIQPFTNVECPSCETHNRVKVDVGSYVLQKRQGVGGMSLVFRAKDKTLGREVAIKILNESYSMDEARIAQFEQEAKITAAISHPHVVRVYTVGQAFERFFIAMELVPGASLEQVMHDQGALPESDVLRWGREVCEGLNAANDEGLIHRDIKPGNILFDAEGHVKIVDFGLALVTQGGKAQADEIWATPYYVPPETLDAREEDFRGDIYALGATLYHALVGEVPFSTDSRSTTELRNLKVNLMPLKARAPWLNAETCAVIDKAMAFDENERYGSYKEIIDALNRAEIIVGGGVLAAGDSLVDPGVEGGMSKGLLGMIAGGVVVLCIIVALVVGGGGGGDSDGSGGASGVDVKGLTGSDDGGDAGKRLTHRIKEARRALRSKQYDRAANYYSMIINDKRFSLDSVMWAGLQGCIASGLNGSGGGSDRMLRSISRFYKEASEREGGEGGEVLGELAEKFGRAVPELVGFERVRASSLPDVDSEVGAMIAFAAGLKSWDLGYTHDAMRFFMKVDLFSREEGREFSEEFKIYTSLIGDYRDDVNIVRQFGEEYVPADMAELVQRGRELREARLRAKTRGRILENFKEWIFQLDIHQNRMKHEQAMKLAEVKEEDGGEKEEPGGQSEEKGGVDWQSFYDGLKEPLSDADFVLARKMLNSAKFDSERSLVKKEQMIYLCEHAEGFLESLSSALSGEQKSEIELKDGATFTKFKNMSMDGMTVMRGATERSVRWGEIKVGSVIELHQLSLQVKDFSSFEKRFRLEQAICYAWLGGEKSKAISASKNLEKKNPGFKARWTKCMKVLSLHNQ